MLVQIVSPESAKSRSGSPRPPRRIVLDIPSEPAARLNTSHGTVSRDSTLRREQMLMVQVLDRGRALRAMFPGFDSVAFVPHRTAEYKEFDLCVNAPAGDIVNLGQGPGAHVALARFLVRTGFPAIAVDDLTRACAAYPDDAS